MKTSNLKYLAAVSLLAVLFSGCSGPAENAGSTNSNSPQQANSNSAAQPAIAENSAPPAPIPMVQPMPPPAAKAPTDDTAKLPEKPAANQNPNDVNAAANKRAPKLVAPEKKLDFGKQPQDKTLIRAIFIKNAGKEDLKIEAVTPSCGCTTVEFPKLLRAGQAGSIKLKVETGKSPGPHTKSVTIKSNDPIDPSRIVSFEFDVKG